MNNDGVKYLTPKRIMGLLDVSYSTIKRWERQDKIRYITKNSGHKLYDISSIISKKEITYGKKICYCRVSTCKQSKDLDRQIKYCQEKYPDYEIIKDIGSALNWERKGLITLLDQVFKGDIQEVVVSHKDRLCRFGFELLQYIFDQHGVSLVVLDQEIKSQQEEFTEDILSIITVFSNRYYGKRKYSLKNQENTIVS